MMQMQREKSIWSQPTTWRRAALAAVLWSALAAAPASALSLAVTGGGLTEGPSVACLTGAALCEPEADFGFAGDAQVSGTIEIVGGVLSVDIQIGSARFEALAPSGLPGDVEGVDFSSLSYSGSAAVNVTDLPDFFSALAFVAGSGSVSGDYATEDGTPSPVDPLSPFDVDTPLTNVNCLVVAGAGQCSLQFGRSGFTLGLDGEDHDFIHFLNVSVVTTVPEPSSAVLLGCAGLGWWIRRRRRV